MEIPLTQGKTLLIDDEDWPLVRDYSWHAARDKNTYYAMASVRYGPNLKITHRIHRLILAARPGEIVDHINGNGIDNRRSNLRFVTNSENLMNHVNSRRRSEPGRRRHRKSEDNPT